MEDAPYPTNEKEAEEELTEAIDECHAFELGAGAGWDHGADTWEARDAVKDKTYDGECLIERNYSFLAACYAFISRFLDLASLDHFPFQFTFWIINSKNHKYRIIKRCKGLCYSQFCTILISSIYSCLVWAFISENHKTITPMNMTEIVCWRF